MKRPELEKMVRDGISRTSIFEIETVFPPDYVRLYMNENFFVETEVIRKLVLEACEEIDFRKYPRNLGALAVEALSNFLGIDEARIYAGNGLDDVMDVFFRTFVNEGSRVLIVEPTFSVYSHLTRLNDGEVETVMLNTDFSLNIEGILEAAERDISLIVLCSPNNPTGNQFPKGAIEEVLKTDSLVILDEAYVHYADYSFMREVEKYDNLVVMRTFSKVFGLAGIRGGYLVSTPEVVELMRKATIPFHMNQLTQVVLSKALKMWSYFEEKAKLLIEEREWLQRRLSEMDGILVYPSKTNFILMRITKEGLTSEILRRRLRERKVLVRDVSDRSLLTNCLRVTVGTRSQNEAFISAFEEALRD